MHDRKWRTWCVTMGGCAGGVQDGQPLGNQHYWGVYMGLERIKRGKHRVPVEKLNPDEDISGEGEAPLHGCLNPVFRHACRLLGAPALHGCEQCGYHLRHGVCVERKSYRTVLYPVGCLHGCALARHLQPGTNSHAQHEWCCGQTKYRWLSQAIIAAAC
jgi:hypothetical protein